MRMRLEDISSKAGAIARELNLPVDVASVVATDGGSDHLELLLTISGCHQEPCAVVVTVPRDDQDFESVIRDRIRKSLASHTDNT